MEITDRPTSKTSPPIRNATHYLNRQDNTFIGGTVGIAVGVVVMVLLIVVILYASIRMYHRRKQRQASEVQKESQNQPKVIENGLWHSEHSKSVSSISERRNSIYEVGLSDRTRAASASFLSSLDYCAAKQSELLPTGEQSEFCPHRNHGRPSRCTPRDRHECSNSHELGTHYRNATQTSGAFGIQMPPGDQRRSVASADSGLALSLASVADADYQHSGPISSRHLHSLCESLSTPPVRANATVQTRVSPNSSCHDGSCRSPSCMRCSSALAPGIVEESSIGCTLETIRELVRQFEELRLDGLVSVRSVYCTPSFAIADLDDTGGCLITADGSCSLTVPAGALAKRQTIYFGIIYENSSTSDSGAEECGEANFTPIFECGPDGLRFLKPVQLRTHHCVGPGSDLGQITAFVREGGRTDWSDDSDAGVTYDGENAVLSLTHFTGYKLATNMHSSRSTGAGSRIPRLVPQQPPLMKELYLCSFRCDGKVRVYYMGRDDALYDKIYAQELGLGNTLNSPKKPFSFIYNNGNLLMDASHGARRRFDLRGVMSNNYDYAEFCKIEGISSFDIEIWQENGGTSSCIIVATFGSHGRAKESPPLSTFSSENTLKPLTVSPPVAAGHPTRGFNTATLVPTMDISSSSSSFAKGRVESATDRSPQTASLTKIGSLSFSLSLHSPAESCECTANGAVAASEAGCCHAHPRRCSGRSLSPDEHNDDTVASSLDSAQPQLNRDGQTRQSKESGYASVSSFAELQGPQTILES